MRTRREPPRGWCPALCLAAVLGCALAAHGVEPATVVELPATGRSYRLHAPPGRTGPLPLVLMLHGGGGTARAAEYETGWSAKADQEGFLVAYGEATPPDPSKPPRFGANGPTWNDGSGRFEAGAAEVDDVGYVRALLDDVAGRLAVDPRRVYVTGFSNGASMTFRVGAELSDRVAAIAPVAGASWVEELHPTRPLSVLYLVGLSDPATPFEGGEPRLAGKPIGGRAKPAVMESVRQWATALGCPTSARTDTLVNGVRTVAYGPGRDASEVRLITVDDLGHTWAGGRSLLPQWMVGPTSSKLDATDAIWRFFCEHPVAAPLTEPATGGETESRPERLVDRAELAR